MRLALTAPPATLARFQQEGMKTKITDNLKTVIRDSG